MRDWITETAEEMPIEHLPEALQTLAQSIGMETTLRVIEHLGGMSMYFPKLEHLVRPIRDNNIRKEFTGSNYRALARKYNLTETRMRDIIHKRTRP
ncbi:MAG: DNA-binding protein [Spirochaetae bacterium HGW-Spirochaetae-5]|nr:MAG: DNA-binding protein [Spirochaetae bacterium HGW-Spirochaetae-5]